MSEANTKPNNEVKSKLNKLEALREKARKAQEAAKAATAKLKEEEKKAFEFNKKEVLEILRREGLDQIPADKWIANLNQIKSIFDISALAPTIASE